MSLVLEDWNVVAGVDRENVGPGKFDLSYLGTVGETDYSNILVLRVDDIGELLETLEQKLEEQSNFFEPVRMIRPVRRKVTFDTPEQFRSRVAEAALEFAPVLEGREFDVHVSLRGEAEELGAESIGLHIQETLENRLEEEGKREEAGDAVSGSDVESELERDPERPEAVLDIETVGLTGGLAAWTRGELVRYPFLALG